MVIFKSLEVGEWCHISLNRLSVPSCSCVRCCSSVTLIVLGPLTLYATTRRDSTRRDSADNPFVNTRSLRALAQFKRHNWVLMGPDSNKKPPSEKALKNVRIFWRRNFVIRRRIDLDISTVFIRRRKSFEKKRWQKRFVRRRIDVEISTLPAGICMHAGFKSLNKYAGLVVYGNNR